MIVDAVKRRNKIIYWERQSKKRVVCKEAPVDYTFYAPVYEGDNEEPDAYNLKGEPVRLYSFNTFDAKKNALRRHSRVYESDFSPVGKFLSENSFDIDSNNELNTIAFDIEVNYHGTDYAPVEDPFEYVTSFSIYHFNEKRYTMIIYCPQYDKDIVLSDDECPVDVYRVDSERELFLKFKEIFKNVDVFTFWNGEKYDLPYLQNRLYRLFPESPDFCNSFFCRNGFHIIPQDKKDDYGNDYIKYTPVGRQYIDYMLLFKKFDTKTRPSYSLDNICQEFLDVKKLEYKGSLGDLYREDPQTYYEYSLHDSRLLKLLDNTFNYLDIVKEMSKNASIRIGDVLGSLKYIEGSIYNYAHHRRTPKTVLPDKGDYKKEMLPGAYNINCSPGRYGYMMSIDLASQYPSIIRSLNISPETMLFQLNGRHKDFLRYHECEDPDTETVRIKTFDMDYPEAGDYYDLTISELRDFIREENFCISANGTVFDNSFYGIIPEILSVWYKERKHFKKLKAESKSNGDDLNALRYDTKQYRLKISLNSTYGAMTNKYCRFYNIELGRSITLSGREVLKYQSWKGDEIINRIDKELSLDDNEANQQSNKETEL